VLIIKEKLSIAFSIPHPHSSSLLLAPSTVDDRRASQSPVLLKKGTKYVWSEDCDDAF
jgi:hypothetical protein